MEDTPATKGGKGGKRDLQEAYREVREMLTDPSRLVRAVASGKAKGADPEWRRLEMRPVALKGGVKLQVVKYDERQAFTSNHAYAGATPSAPRGRRGRRAAYWNGASECFFVPACRTCTVSPGDPPACATPNQPVVDPLDVHPAWASWGNR